MAARKVIVPAGIGDSIWVLQLLVNQPEAFDWVLPGGNPRRGKQVFDLLPATLVHSCEYAEDRRLGYDYLRAHNAQVRSRTWADHLLADPLFLSANEWLETGNPLEDFLVDLPLSHELPWQLAPYAAEAHKMTAQHEVRIGIYGSSYSTSRAWGFWQEKGWFELIQLVHEAFKARGKRATFYVIGAAWDLNLAGGLLSMLVEHSIDHVALTGRELGLVAQVMQRFHYAFYFPSGLPILSETLPKKSPCTMFYPPHLALMQGKWADPARLASGEFKECQFCTPQQIFDWVVNEYQLLDKVV